MKIKYKGWDDLFTLWAQGKTDIVPCRARWPYRVQNDILVADLPKKQLHAVGIPATSAIPRMSYYLVSHWRGRSADREKIESLGGVPVMPFELADALEQMGHGHLAPMCALDRHPEDPAMFLFIQEWLVHAAKGDPTRYVTRAWRSQTYAVVSKGNTLLVGRRDRGGQVKRTVMAEWDPQLRAVGVLSQVHRSPALNWVKDAVYVAASRLQGLGTALSLRRMGNVRVKGKVLGVEGTAILVKPTPSFLLRDTPNSG